MRLVMQRRAAKLFEAARLRPSRPRSFCPSRRSARRACHRAAATRFRTYFQALDEDFANVLLGFGASAIGRLPQGYVQNAADVGTWRGALEAGRLPVVRGVALGAEDVFRAKIIERLMCDFSVDLAEFAARS